MVTGCASDVTRVFVDNDVVRVLKVLFFIETGEDIVGVFFLRSLSSDVLIIFPRVLDLIIASLVIPVLFVFSIKVNFACSDTLKILELIVPFEMEIASIVKFDSISGVVFGLSFQSEVLIFAVSCALLKIAEFVVLVDLLILVEFLSVRISFVLCKTFCETNKSGINKLVDVKLFVVSPGL